MDRYVPLPVTLGNPRILRLPRKLVSGSRREIKCRGAEYAETCRNCKGPIQHGAPISGITAATPCRHFARCTDRKAMWQGLQPPRRICRGTRAASAAWPQQVIAPSAPQASDGSLGRIAACRICQRGRVAENIVAFFAVFQQGVVVAGFLGKFQQGRCVADRVDVVGHQ